MKKKMIPLYFIISIIILYLLMFQNTNTIVEDVKKIMHGNVEKSMTLGTPLSRYNNSNILENAVVKVRVTRLFVWHNFIDGYMWVSYTYETIKNDKDFKPGSWNVFSKWKIHKKNGKWKVVEIEEAA